MAVLGKNIFWGPAPSSFGRQQRLSEIIIETIKNLGAWARPGQDLGACVPPGPSLKPPLLKRCVATACAQNDAHLLPAPLNLRPNSTIQIYYYYYYYYYYLHILTVEPTNGQWLCQTPYLVTLQ